MCASAVGENAEQRGLALRSNTEEVFLMLREQHQTCHFIPVLVFVHEPAAAACTTVND